MVGNNIFNNFILMCFIIENYSVVGLFHSTNNLVEVMTEICTSETCPSMNGPSGNLTMY